MKVNLGKLIFIEILTLLMSIMHTGCIMYTSRAYQSLAHSETRNLCEKKKNICYEFKRTTKWNGVGFDRDKGSEVVRGTVAVAQDRDVALKQFQDEFSDVAIFMHDEIGDSENSGIIMNIHLQNSWNKSVLAFAVVTGATFTVIPCWVEEAYTLYVEAIDARRKINRTYELTSSVNQIIWLPGIFGLPFNDKPDVYIDRITKEHWHELKMRMCADGFFENVNNR